MDLMPTSRRDLVESGKGSKETEFVVSGDELDTPLPNKTPDITSEMERVGIYYPLLLLLTLQFF
jgi:hypothetical protein